MNAPGAAPVAPAAEPVHRSLRLTLASRTLLIVGAALLVAGWSQLWAAQMLAALLLAGVTALVLGWLNLRRVAPSAVDPAAAFAWEPFPLGLRLGNPRHRLAARDLLLHHGIPGEDRLRLFGAVACLRPGGEQALTTSFRLPRRGHYTEHRVTVSSTFPFGLFEWRAGFQVPADLLALPRLGELHHPDAILPRKRLLSGADPARPHGEEDFHSLKEWRDGMSQRRIHWKVSARQQRLILQEYRGGRRPTVHLLLSSRVAGLTDTEGRDVRRRLLAFERAVSLAATLAEHWLRQHFRLRLTILGGRDLRLRPGTGRAGLFRVLGALAMARPEAEGAAGPAGLAAATREGEITILVTAGGGAAGRAGDGGPAGGVAAAGSLVLDVDRPEIREVFRPVRREVPRIRLEAEAA